MSQESLSHATPSTVDLIARARQGSALSLGQLLEQCRGYLLLVANHEVNGSIRPVVAPSDLVQETFLHAQQSFAAFRGQSEAELLGWLRAILLNRQLIAYRRHKDAEQRRIDPGLLHDQSIVFAELARHVIERLPSPSQIAAQAEQSFIVQKSLEQLPADYRQVIHLRYWQQLSFVEIGPRMGRSADAARKLWFRAIERLCQMLERANGQGE